MASSSSSAMAPHGTSSSTGGKGLAPAWVTVMKGSTTQPMTRPITVPAARLTVTTAGFSSHSQLDSSRPDMPSARSSANSVRRWRAETAALMASPMTANRAATTKPMLSAPMMPSATGSALRTRVRSSTVSADSAVSGAARAWPPPHRPVHPRSAIHHSSG